jgi:hypothetical protein
MVSTNAASLWLSELVKGIMVEKVEWKNGWASIGDEPIVSHVKVEQKTASSFRIRNAEEVGENYHQLRALLLAGKEGDYSLVTFMYVEGEPEILEERIVRGIGAGRWEIIATA